MKFVISEKMLTVLNGLNDGNLFGENVSELNKWKIDKIPSLKTKQNIHGSQSEHIPIN